MKITVLFAVFAIACTNTPKEPQFGCTIWKRHTFTCEILGECKSLKTMKIDYSREICDHVADVLNHDDIMSGWAHTNHRDFYCVCNDE